MSLRTRPLRRGERPVRRRTGLLPQYSSRADPAVILRHGASADARRRLCLCRPPTDQDCYSTRCFAQISALQRSD